MRLKKKMSGPFFAQAKREVGSGAAPGNRAAPCFGHLIVFFLCVGRAEWMVSHQPRRDWNTLRSTMVYVIHSFNLLHVAVEYI